MAAGTVNVTGAAKLPELSVDTVVGVVVSAWPSNLNPLTVELAVKPCPSIVTLTPGLVGAPTPAPAGVSANPALIVNAPPFARTPCCCPSMATSVWLPPGTLGTTQLLVIWLPEMVPSGAAVIAQTTQTVSLEALSFERSADVLVMLVLGGAGRLYGGLVGAAIFMVARDQFSGIAPQYWYFWLGILLADGMRRIVDGNFDTWLVNEMEPNSRLRRYLAHAQAWPDLDLTAVLAKLDDRRFF